MHCVLVTETSSFYVAEFAHLSDERMSCLKIFSLFDTDKRTLSFKIKNARKVEIFGILQHGKNIVINIHYIRNDKLLSEQLLNTSVKYFR